MINKNNFNYKAFIEKYKIDYSDSLIKDIIDWFDSPILAYKFIANKIKKRCPELEPLMLSSPECSYYYACDIMRKRWLKAEPIIITDVKYACYYAYDVLKSRWLEAEPIIQKDEIWWQKYNYHFDDNLR